MTAACLASRVSCLRAQSVALPDQQGDRSANPTSRVEPVPLPNLDNMEPLVREQLRAAQANLTAILRKPHVTLTDQSEAYGKLGRLYQAYDLEDAALGCFLNAQRLAPQEFEWQYYLGALQQHKGEFQAALPYFENALRLRPSDEPTLLRLADVNLSLSRPQLAKPFFEKVIALDNSSAAAMVGLGKIALAERQYAAAVDQFNRALVIQPQASSIHYQSAMAYRGLHDVAHAQDHLLKQGPKEPDSPDPLIDQLEQLKKGEGALWIRGTRAMNTGHISEAIEDFRQMVDTSPKDPTARMYLGMALARAGDQKGAVEQYLQALEIAPANPGIHYNFGLVLAEGGSEQQAIEHFRAAVKSNPQLTKAHFQLANLLMRRGDYRDAVPEYTSVITMEPRNGFARLMEAMALVRLNRYSQAKAKLEQAVAVSSDDEDLTAALARLLASCPDRSVRDGARALGLIQRVIQNKKSFDLDQGQTLAMALAGVGQFQRAAQLQGSMIAELEHAHRTDLAALLRPNMALYEHEQPCLTPWRDDDPIFSPVPGKLENTEELQPVAMGVRNQVSR